MFWEKHWPVQMSVKGHPLGDKNSGVQINQSCPPLRYRNQVTSARQSENKHTGVWVRSVREVADILIRN